MVGPEKCDARTAAVFMVGLVASTGCTVCSKVLFQLHAVGLSCNPEPFKPPLYQTWVMFVGMTFALPAHFISQWLRKKRAQEDPELLRDIETQEASVTRNTYLMLIVPSVFDLLSTVLMVVGLLHVDASVWMLLRGGGIVFVALMKHFVIQDTLAPAMWVGVFIIAISVTLVAFSSRMSASADEAMDTSESEATFGVLMTLLGTFVQSVQYTYEEKVMSGDLQAPPWLLIGMEGFCGTLLSTFVLYPLFWLIPGEDHGSYENPFNTITMLSNSSACLWLSLLLCLLVFVLNSFSVLITFMMSSVWHAILDNFRPIAIWTAELALYHGVSGVSFGEPWTTGSWVQLAGMLMLLFGTAVYNGSIKLPGLDMHESLVSTASPMSSPALSRSPLITLNRITLADSPNRPTSPYLSRLRHHIDIEVLRDAQSPMERGHATSLQVPLVGKCSGEG